MKRIETFISEDGKPFENAKDCAEYEFKNIPDFVHKINDVMVNIYPPHQLRWCESGYMGCACMGCCNHEVQKAGFSKEHWEVWVQDYRQPTVADDEDFNTTYSIHFVSGSYSQSELTRYLQSDPFFHGQNLTQIYKYLEDVIKNDKPIISTYSYAALVQKQKEMEDIFGFKTELKKNGKTLRQIIALKNLQE